MLLIFTVLAFFLANVASDDVLPEEVKTAFEELNSYSGRIVWSDELAEKAREYLKSPKSVKADLMIKGNTTSPKKDSSLGMKVYSGFGNLFETNGKNISALPRGTKYGCNFANSSTDEREVLEIVCLYNKN